MNDENNTAGLIHAILLNGHGGGRLLGWQEVDSWTPEQGLLWLHLDYTEESAQRWIREASRLDSLVAQALLMDETRPRTTALGDGLLIALRGINLNQGAKPEDMVSIRLWIEGSRIVSTRKRKLMSVEDLRTRLVSGNGPTDAGGVIAELTNCIVSRMSETVDLFEDRVAAIEDQVLNADTGELRFELSDLRREIIALRRYLAPQREAFARLLQEKVSWLDDRHRSMIREVGDRLIRHIEDLDAVRERASVTQEELVNRISDQLNRRMYVLSIVAAVFLPLGFFTGLLGVNLGGIPGSENTNGFMVFITVLIIALVGQIWYFKQKKWL